MPIQFPIIEDCCGCVTDLKTATAIIAVLGIVSSPAVSWAVVRHSYVVHMSCVITSSITRPDVVDINFNNVVSFGFGTNAGLGPSCLSANRTKEEPKGDSEIVMRASNSNSKIVSAVRYLGWAVLLVDLVFVCTSVNLLYRLFNGPAKQALKMFMIVAMLALLLSFIYCMLYVAACMSLGGAFPVVEFVFAFIDLFKWIMWIHFLLVIRTFYANSYKPIGRPTVDFWYSRWMKSLISPWTKPRQKPTHRPNPRAKVRPTTSPYSRRRDTNP